MSKRVVFTFDRVSLTTLQQMTNEGNYASMADCLREALQVSRTMQTLASHGFTEVITRNPRTEQENFIMIPRLSYLYWKNVVKENL